MDFSRREFLKAGLAGSLAVGAGAVLSACGTGNTIKPFTNSTAGKPRTGGQLRAGLTGGSTADTISPLNPITNVDFSRINNLYEPLIGLTPEALPVNVLAEEITPNANATEWTVRVKQGITFHNGKPLTAASVQSELGTLCAENFDLQPAIDLCQTGTFPGEPRVFDTTVYAYTYKDGQYTPLGSKPLNVAAAVQKYAS